MSPIVVSVIVFACVFGAGLLGIYHGSALPKDHLSPDSKSTVMQGMGLIGMMAAVVLGLLVASAKGSYDTQSNALVQMCANVIFLDRTLAIYGPEATGSRRALRDAAAELRDRLESTNGPTGTHLDTPVKGADSLYHSIEELSPKDDAKRTLQGQALNLAANVGQTRWLVYAQSLTSLPRPLLVVLVVWLAIIFMSFGLFAPPNLTVVFTLCISALSVSGAILLTLEMYRPLGGLIRIPTAPLQAAITYLLH